MCNTCCPISLTSSRTHPYHYPFTQIAKRVVGGIFTYGNLLDTSAIFLRVLQAPEVRELTIIGGQRDHRTKYWETVESIVGNIKSFLSVVLHTEGTRTTVNQRAYRTVLAACSGQNLKEQRHVREASEALVGALQILFCSH